MRIMFLSLILICKYEDNPRSRKPLVLSVSEADQPRSYVVSTRGNRNELAEQPHLRTGSEYFNFNFLKQIMSDAGYVPWPLLENSASGSISIKTNITICM